MLEIKMPAVTKSIRYTTKKDVLSALDRTGGGVYFLYGTADSLLYIGKTVSFRDRIADHIRGLGRSNLFSRQIERIEVYRIDDGMSRDIIETFAITEYRPLYNIDKVYDAQNDRSALYVEASELIGQREDVKDRLREVEAELAQYDDEDDEELFDDFHDDDYREEVTLGNHLNMVVEYAELKSEYDRLSRKIRYLGRKSD